MLIIISPIALKLLANLHGINWQQLSSIGQTYGAASSLITGLALLGVVVSIYFQIKAVKVGIEQSSREHHFHLAEMAMQDRAYRNAWGPDMADDESDFTYRQHAYINLILSFWERDYVLGQLPDTPLRNDLSRLFEGEVARTYWSRNRASWLGYAQGNRCRRFIRLADEEYAKAIRSGPPAVKAMRGMDEGKKKTRKPAFITKARPLATAALTCAVLAVTVRALHDLGDHLGTTRHATH